MPKISPTAAATRKATTIDHAVSCVSTVTSVSMNPRTTGSCSTKGSTCCTPIETATPSTMPTIPPTAVSDPVSTRNCATMCRRVAPSARRMPISRVRSVTEASMMFMIPMPPTSRLIAAMEMSTMFHTSAVFLAFSRSSHGTMISTSLSSA